MLTKLFVFLFLFSLASTNKIKPKEFCNLKINGNNCQSPFSYRCRRSICSKNETVCKIYKELEKSFRFQVKLKFKFNYAEIKERFKFFNSKIKKCTAKAFGWKPSEICVSGSNCYKRIKSKWAPLSTQMLGMRYQLEKIDCPCKGNLTYACSAGYCTLNKKTCDVFDYKDQKMTGTKAATASIKNCENDFLILNLF